MLPYQARRRQARQRRESEEILLAREIQKQRPDWLWMQCIAEAKRDLCRRW